MKASDKSLLYFLEFGLKKSTPAGSSYLGFHFAYSPKFHPQDSGIGTPIYSPKRGPHLFFTVSLSPLFFSSSPYETTSPPLGFSPPPMPHPPSPSVRRGATQGHVSAQPCPRLLHPPHARVPRDGRPSSPLLALAWWQLQVDLAHATGLADKAKVEHPTALDKAAWLQ